MSGSERVIKKREARIKQRNKERQDLFASDYVKHKYPAIYAEAVQVFQILTNQYPNKLDARKTDEHKVWKTTDPSILHPAFNIRQASVLPPQAHVKIYFPEQTPNPEPLAIMEPPIIEPPNSEPSHQTPNPEPLAIMEPPIIEPPNSEPSHQTPNPEPLAIMEPPIIEPPNSEPSHQTPNPEPLAITEPPTTEPQESPEPPTYVDNMQLIIPLLKPPKKHSDLITQTLDIVTEETLQTCQQPLRMGQLDPQILEQLMAELRADPMLKDLFSDLEQQIEFEGPDGMDIDIDIGMDTRLEDQIENWEFW